MTAAFTLADPADHPPDEALLAWMLDPTDLDQEPVADHLFACARCSARTLSLRTVVGALAQMQRHAHEPIQTRQSLAALEARGERLQHFFGVDGGEVTGELSADADIVIMHLPVPGAADSPLTVSLCEPDGRVFASMPAAGAEDGEVMLACYRRVAQGNQCLRVKVTRAGSEEVLCDARFAQAPR
jgi:hypothetical protein